MSRRATTLDNYRAKAWRDIHDRPHVLALPNRAYRLLCQIIHKHLQLQNNGALDLGPERLRPLGFADTSGQDAVEDLLKARLLEKATVPRKGARTYYRLTFLPFTVPYAHPTARAVGSTTDIVEKPTAGAGGDPPKPTARAVTPTAGAVGFKGLH